MATSLERSENEGQKDHFQSFFLPFGENFVKIDEVDPEAMRLQGGPLK